MNQHLRLAAVALLAAGLAACSGVSSSVPHSQTQQPMNNYSAAGIDLSRVHVMPTRDMIGAGYHVNPDITLTYANGPVLQKPAVYVVYWGFNGSSTDPSGEQTYLTNFLTGVGGSPWNNINHQYYEIVAGVTKHIKNPTGELLGTWNDTTNPEPASPTDAQIQAEAGRLMAHFAFNKNASYVVATSHGHNTSGFGTNYCAYHGATTQGGHTIAYTNLPYITDAGPSCGQSWINPGPGGLLDGVSTVEGHEYSESITDPQPFSGWNSFQGEIGDLCAWQSPPGGDITLSTGKFAVQGLFSNKTHSCVLHFP